MNNIDICMKEFQGVANSAPRSGLLPCAKQARGEHLELAAALRRGTTCLPRSLSAQSCGRHVQEEGEDLPCPEAGSHQLHIESGSQYLLHLFGSPVHACLRICQ